MCYKTEFVQSAISVFHNPVSNAIYRHDCLQQHIEPMTFFSLVIAVVAASITGYQVFLMRRSHGVDLVMNFIKQFEGDDFVEKIKKDAKASKDITLDNKQFIEDVLDFFETMGLLTRTKVIGSEFVWHSFFYWVQGYWIYLKEFIEKQREIYPTRYADYIWLHDKMIKIEEKKSGTIILSEWADFLEEESGCDVLKKYNS